VTDFETWLVSHEDRHSRDDERFDTLCEDVRQIREDLSRRLPLWATFVLTGAGGVIGSLLTVISFLKA
jgi:hypothetical protein